MTTFNVEIVQDMDPMNPRTGFDHLGVMLCWHKRYNLGDKSDYNASNYNSWDELEKAIQKEEDQVIILPLYMYDHGNVTISTSPFSCSYDSGRIGVIFARREDVLKEFGKKRISKKLLKTVEEVLLGEVQEYDQYLKGDVHGYIITDDRGEHVDSCYGFFGHDYCEKEAANVVAYLKQQEIDDAVKTKTAQSAMPCCQP